MSNFLDKQVEVPRRTMVLFFIVDTSSSMYGEKIGILNNAIEEVLPEIAKISDSNPDAEIKIAILDFSTDAVWTTPKPVPAGEYMYNYLEASGLTAMGAAFNKLNEKLSRNEFMQEIVGSFAPVLFLLSDGEPNDDWEKALNKLKTNNWYKKAIKVAVAIGNDADLNVLQKFTGSSESVLTVHTPKELAAMVRFVSVTSSEIGSKSSSVGLGVGTSEETNSIKSKQENFNEALAAMAPAILSNDNESDEDEIW